MAQDRKQINVRIDETILRKIDDIRRMSSPIPNRSQAVIAAIHAYYHSLQPGAAKPDIKKQRSS
jgi:metal-responsive CopG/Arc/MetJ family transcriptional regulator